MCMIPHFHPLAVALMEPNELFLGGALLLNKSYSSSQRDEVNRQSQRMLYFRYFPQSS